MDLSRFGAAPRARSGHFWFEGLEAYASGRIASQAELKRFFDAQPAFPKELPNRQIRQQKVSDMIARVIYAG